MTHLHEIAVLFGQNADHINANDLHEALEGIKLTYGPNFRDEYQLLHKVFATKEEKTLFTDTLFQCSAGEDMLIIKDHNDIEYLLSVFEQAPSRAPSYAAQLARIKSHLDEIKNSDWIVFTSPSPCSTEMAIRKRLLQAVENISQAALLAASLHNGESLAVTDINIQISEEK